MRVRWSLQALAQVRAIHARIAQDNPKAAADVVAAIEATADGIGEFQASGPPTSKPNYRTKLVVPYPAYRIFYRVSPSEVVIARVRDTRRRPLPE